jgi:L-threonylcarbamoyladenylate synthase
MTTALIYQNDPQTREAAAGVIRQGGVIAFRTDTFYGLGADPFNPAAVGKIKELKGRDEAKPILILISDDSELDRFTTNRNLAFQRAVKLYWPGPLTLITHAREQLPAELTAGTETLGVRLPDDDNVRALVRACGGALTATSANVSGQPPARTAKEVENYFPRGIDLIVDGGAVTTTQASTVLDVSGSEVRLVREGAISRDQLKEVLVVN